MRRAKKIGKFLLLVVQVFASATFLLAPVGAIAAQAKGACPKVGAPTVGGPVTYGTGTNPQIIMDH